VHAEELSYWFSAEMARRKARYDFKLILSVWETLPQLTSYRTLPDRVYRRATMRGGDRFLAVTERARQALELEGVPDWKLELCPPGLDLDRFRRAVSDPDRSEHVILSAGRLVWEKGHQDVLRAVAALEHGIGGLATEPARNLRVVILGSGREELRLRRFARELGIEHRTTFVAEVPYAEMPRMYANASCLVLASLPRTTSLVPGRPRHFWEEQFGMVLPEAMASGLRIVASMSGAIPEVAAECVEYFAPGDWQGLARLLLDGALRESPRARVTYSASTLERLSTSAAADRLSAAYDVTLASRSDR